MTVATRPTLGAPRPFRFPDSDRREVAGATVVACDLPGKPLGNGRVILDAGAEREGGAPPGVAAIMASAFKEGSAALDAVGFSDALERLGARVSTGAGWDSVEVGVTAPVENLPDALRLVGEALRTPTFPTEAIERLRTERVNHLRQMRAVPMARALLASYETLWEQGSLYARPSGGDIDDVEAIDREAVNAYFSSVATSAPAHLIIAGDLTGIDVGGVAQDVFGERTVAEPGSTPPARPRMDGRRVVIIDRPGSVQSAIFAGHHAPPRASADQVPLDILMDTFAGMFNSRLTMILREDKGYTYGVNAGTDGLRRGGQLITVTSVETGVTAPSVEIIAREFATMAADGVTQEELDRARDAETGQFALRNETAPQIAGLLSVLVTYDLPPDHFDRETEARAALTVSDMRDAAVRLMLPDQLKVIVVGDAEQIREPIEALGIGVVTVAPD